MLNTGVTITRQLGQYIVEHKGRTVCSTKLQAVAELVASQLSDCIEYGEGHFQQEVVDAKQQVLNTKASNGHYNTDDNKDYTEHL